MTQADQLPTDQAASDALAAAFKATGLDKLNALDAEQAAALAEVDELRRAILERFATQRAAIMREIGTEAKR